jgi:hypothetical protein
MKKLLIALSILLISLPAIAGITEMMSAVVAAKNRASSGGECIKDETPIADGSLADGSGKILDGTDAVGESFQYGSEFRLYSIEIYMTDASSSCVADIKVGSSSDLTGGNVIESWDSVAFADDETPSEVVSVQNDTYSASTAYYFGVNEASGDCRVRKGAGDPYASGDYHSTNSGWTLDPTGDSDDDLRFRVYKCQ